MKHIASGLLGLLVCISTAHADKIPTKSGDYCKDEAQTFLKEKFGEQIKINYLKKIGNGSEWRYYAGIDQCDGYFMFEYMNMENLTCKSAQYGSRTYYLRRVTALGDCNRLMPYDEYP